MTRSLPRPETPPSTSSPTTCLWTSVMSTSRPSPHIDEAYLAVCLFSVITPSFLDRHSTFPSPTYLSQCAHISAIVRESRGGIHVNLTIARRDSSDKTHWKASFLAKTPSPSLFPREQRCAPTVELCSQLSNTDQSKAMPFLAS